MSGKVNVKKFRKVLVANRGEIAIRIFRALSELGITTVSIFSKEDRYAMFRSKADESYPLNPQKGPIDAYLDIDTIIKIALSTGVDAIHPGYGFLSENPDFADACAIYISLHIYFLISNVIIYLIFEIKTFVLEYIMCFRFCQWYSKKIQSLYKKGLLLSEKNNQ